MANLGFSLRSTFGFIPKTEKIELQRKSLHEEFNRFQEYKESEELKEYLELDNYINSNDFKNAKNEILSLNFKNTEEFKKEQQYLKLKKNKKVINHFKVLESTAYKEFLKIEESEKLDEFKSLENYLDSQEHKNVIASYNQKLQEEVNKQKEYKSLSKSKQIINYYKILNSDNLKLYNELVDSDELKTFNELKTFFQSNQLNEFKKAIAEQYRIEKDKKNELKVLLKDREVIAYKKLKEKGEVEKPEALIEYEKLYGYLASNEYQQKLSELTYKNTEEFKKEQQYKALQKSPRLKKYFKFANSPQLAFFNEFKDSKKLKHYQALKTYVESEEFIENQKNATYKNSDEFKKEEKFDELKNSSDIKTWQNYQKTKTYKLYKETENSEFIANFNELTEFVNSDKFKEFKAYMLDKEKWQKTDDHRKEIRYNELKNSENIKWYFNVKDSDKFNELLSWKVTFDDDFDAGKVDDQKWMNSFFWGKMLLNDRYVMAGDKHFYTDNKNVELNGTTLKIVTKKEKAKGKVWNPVHGFYETDFEYTSGMLTTAHSFRQKYGRFEAKIKIDSKYPVYQAFWLKGDKILPEINVFNFNLLKKNRLQLSNFWGDPMDLKSKNENTEKMNGTSLSKGFFIYTLDWTPEKISWKINGIEVHNATTGIPTEPLYLLLSAGIQKDVNTDILPSTFEIDWIRCYEKVN